MIHKAQVLICTPGQRWALDMQTKRAELVSAINLVKPEFPKVMELIEFHLYCRDIMLKSLDGKLIDEGDLEYEFVTYDRASRKIIIAVFVGDGDVGSPIRFAELFPDMRHGEAYEDDRAFLNRVARKGIYKRLGITAHQTRPP